MTIYGLIDLHSKKHHNSHFFDSETLRFFGETIGRMRVLKNTAEVTDVCGEKHTCYVVSATRTKNWNGRCKPYTHYHYFDVTTLDSVIL